MTIPAAKRKAAITRILDGLSVGTPLAVLCREDGMPGLSTFYEWKDADAALSGRIAHARDLGWDAIAWRLRETARGRGDSSGDVQRDKLIIETDLKLLAKWDPKRYGELVKLAGSDGQSAVMSALSVTFVQAPAST